MVKIVAEITANHLGDVDRARDIASTALAQGADYVKFQRRVPEILYPAAKLQEPFDSPFGWTFGDYRWGLELTDSDFDTIDREFEGRWFASVLDAPSFDSIATYGVPFMKLPSTISGKHDLFGYVAEKWNKPLVMSLGMTGMEHFVFVRDLIQGRLDAGKPGEGYDYVLQCTSAYPAPAKELNLALIQQMDFEPIAYLPGYSSHDEGSLGSMLAVAAGAQMIEKHVTLPGAEWVERNGVSMDLSTSEFRDYVAGIRLAEEMMGTGTPKVTPSENHKYQ